MRAPAVVLALAIALAPAAARADGALLDKAQQAIDGVDYDGAQKLVEQAMQQGLLSSADLARAHMLAGEIAAVLDDTAGAREHFVTWILLDPSAALPAGASPKLTEPFDEAKQRAAELGEMSIDVRVERDGDNARVLLDARDPLNVIVGLRAEGGGNVANERGTSVELPATGPDAMEITVTALDEHDDQIAVRTVTLDADIGDEGPPLHLVQRGHRWPFVVRWPTWTAFAVASLAAGGYFQWQVGKDHDALDALNADSSNHTFDEALAIEDRGKRHALDADIAIGVGAAFAVVAVLTAVLEPHPRIETMASVTPAGAGVTIAGHF